MKYFLLIAFCLYSNVTFSQIRLRNTDLTNADSNILFRDIKNHIEITGIKNMAMHQVVLNGAYMNYVGDRNLLLTNFSSDTVLVNVFSVGKGKPTLAYSKKYLVQELGSPTIVLDEKKNDTLSNGQIWNGTTLEVKFPNVNYGGDFRVAHFEISLFDPTGREVLPSTFISGKYLTSTIYDKVAALPQGSRIKFKQVILTYSGGDYVQYKDFSLRKI